MPYYYKDGIKVDIVMFFSSRFDVKYLREGYSLMIPKTRGSSKLIQIKLVRAA